jgi:predicted CopG family antitoxin
MGAKNISIPESVYERLKDQKGDDESFGDAIDRLLDSRPLEEFWGAWDEETADRTREAIREGRARSDEKIAERYR